MYKSEPDLAAFASAFPLSRAPVAYNGNVVDKLTYNNIMSTIPELDHLMLGRGAVTDPALFRVLRGGDLMESAELSAFLECLERSFLEAGLGEHFTLARLKEVWYYVIYKFPNAGRQQKAINKARTLADYHSAVSALFAAGLYGKEAAFRG